MSTLEEWESVADEFHADTGYLRPGKDDVSSATSEERYVAWTVWCQMRRKLEKAHRAGFSAGLEAGAKACDDYRRQIANNAAAGKFSQGVDVDLLLCAPLVCAERIRALLAEATTTTERGRG